MFHRALQVNDISLKRLASVCGLTGFCVLAWCGLAWAEKPVADSLDAGFRHMYNLNFHAAHKIFENWQELHPDDPLGAASNAAAYLFSEFDRMHILEFQLFADTDRLKDRLKLGPNSQIRAAFESEAAKAERIAEEILAQMPNATNALFAQVLVNGLRGDYAALIEKKNGDGLDYLKASRSIAQKLIDIDPTYYDAYLAIGLENYVAGLRSAPVRWFLRMSGTQTNKNDGIAKLKITAEKGQYLGPYARILLAIAAIRDKNPRTARELLMGLVHEFPQNRLYRSELAALGE
jgi:hypothetical protein